MSGPKAMFVALATAATVATAQTPLRIEPMPGGATPTVPAQPAAPSATPAGPQAMQLPPAMAERIRNNSKTFANDVAIGGMKELQGLIADKGSSCDDLGSIFKSQQGIIQNQRDISRLPAMRAILEDEMTKAKVPEVVAETKGKLAKRCPSTKLD